MPLFILLFLAVPLVELYILIQVGQVIGALPTIALCIFTAVAGGLLLRYQGLQTLFRAQATLARRELPAVEMFEGVGLALGGLLLMTPGFITDAAGLICLLPWTRRGAVRAVLRRLQARGRTPPGGPSSHQTIEGEFRRHD